MVTCIRMFSIDQAYRLVFSTIACFAFIFSFDLICWFGPLFPSYAVLHAMDSTPTPHFVYALWYPIIQFSMALAFTAFYFCWRHRDTHNAHATMSRAALYRDGLGFGGFVGLLMGIGMISLYVALNLPGISPIVWGFFGLAKGLVLGLILTALHPKSRTHLS